MAAGSMENLSADARLHIVQEGLRSEDARRRVCEHRQIPLKVFNKWQERVIKAGKNALGRGEGAAGPGGRKFTADDKVGIILQAMMDGTSASDVCHRHHVSARQYERWRSAFLAAGEEVLARRDWASEFSAPVVAAVVAILVVVLLGGGWIVWRAARGAPILPWGEGQGLDQNVLKVDLETGEVFVKTAREWRTLKRAGARWENPTTGENTLTAGIVCSLCGETIPTPDLPVHIIEQGPAAIAGARPDYVCPKCGQSPYDMSVLPPGPRGRD